MFNFLTNDPDYPPDSVFHFVFQFPAVKSQLLKCPANRFNWISFSSFFFFFFTRLLSFFLFFFFSLGGKSHEKKRRLDEAVEVEVTILYRERTLGSCRPASGRGSETRFARLLSPRGFL